MAYLPNKKMQSMIIIIMIIEPTDFETNPSSSVMHPNLKSTEWMHLNAGWWLTYPSEKYEFVSWDFLPNIWKNKICSKPLPTRMDPYMGIGGWLIISPQIPITDLGALEELASHARFDCMFLIRILWTRQSHLVRFLSMFLSLSDHK